MTTRTSQRASAFDQAGGFDAVTQAVSRLFDRLSDDPMVAPLLDPAYDTDARWQAELLLTDLLGGPMAYDGPEPRVVAAQVGIDTVKTARLIDHAAAAFAAGGCDPALTQEIRGRLEGYAALQDLLPARSAAPVQATSDASAAAGGPERLQAALVALAQRELAVAGAGWKLFVLDNDLAVVHVSPEARRAAAACESDLRRAFNLGAADLLGTSILRFHSAPTQLQTVLTEPTRLPHETSWSFGRTVWKARFAAVRGPDGATLGYAVLWRDESDAYRNQEVFQRLRTQAEDLPVPVMFPDPTQERWFGNAACENALERLAPHLPHPVSALDGVPISIFFPDEARRRKLFGDPDLLPHKEQVQIGPETVAILVTPVRDQEQHYLGPQITWEIIHFTRPVEPVSHAAEPAAVASPLLPAAGNESSSLGPSLRLQARALETATHELQTVIRLLETAADELEGESPVPAAHGQVALPEAIRLAQTAAAALMAVRQSQPSPARHDELSRAVATITTIARRTNQLALDAALLSVHEDVNHAAEGLHQGSRVFAEGLAERVRSLSSQAQASADALRQAKATAARLAQLRIEFDIDPDPA